MPESTIATGPRTKGRQLLDILAKMNDAQLREAALEVALDDSWVVKAFLGYVADAAK